MSKKDLVKPQVVETMGLEPTTPCLQSRCSSQLSYVPGDLERYRWASADPREFAVTPELLALGGEDPTGEIIAAPGAEALEQR